MKSYKGVSPASINSVIVYRSFKTKDRLKLYTAIYNGSVQNVVFSAMSMLFSLALLLFFATIFEVESYTCSRPIPTNCINSSRVYVHKNQQFYQLFLKDTNGELIPASGALDDLIWFNCNDVCDFCQWLSNDNSTGITETKLIPTLLLATSNTGTISCTIQHEGTINLRMDSYIV